MFFVFFVSVEDAMAQDDFGGWKQITDAIGDRCRLVGDDLYWSAD